MDDTIFALSSGPGIGGVAVLRLSGPRALSTLDGLCPGKPRPDPRRATLRRLIDPDTGTRLDEALVLTFPGPHSFTGEDVVELHVHGGRAVVEGVLATLSRQSGCRMAEPGEFSRRAFDNGRLDLTEVEGLGDLIQAQTAAQKEQALRQMDGVLRRLYEGWRERLMQALARLEADIDFPDEDLPEGIGAAVRPELGVLRNEMARHLADGARGRTLRDGFRIVLLGAPNAGKSTLMNRLAQSDVAIVTTEAGTTRDVLDVQMDLGGYPVRLVDTAGLREGGGAVEREGIRRARERAEQADLKLILVRADCWDAFCAGEDSETAAFIDDRSLLVVTQKDRVDVFHVEHDSPWTPSVALSAETGEGMETLQALLEARVSMMLGGAEAVPLTRQRHAQAVTDAIEHLTRFDAMADQDPVLAAEDVRLASRALGRITGRVGVEDMLDKVFSEFCIGK
ncbi:tRNA uridine-5-carboxymethylaminomethyl(34) synthesis GTPase MnmE [Yunchengibacter salinarum]|uniref:tRNA uridine-5-carboxymethylaminomethyl(34) synthesis GTPase MnmE n=1 Tax=Yunchengibacter salinarum TaxID=3133399 RepID=UPI0035B693AB